jgi:hypothetical protein
MFSSRTFIILQLHIGNANLSSRYFSTAVSAMSFAAIGDFFFGEGGARVCVGLAVREGGGI